MLGRLVHLGFDALAISAVLAGVKKSTGYAPDTSQIPSDTWIRTTVDGYFGAGETIFNFVTGQAVTSPYFKRTS